MSLHVRGLRRQFPGLDVLRGVDLDVAAGEVVAIRGASGTGKSTLLHCLGLLDRCDSGELSLGGERLDMLPAAARGAARARLIGFVFQAFHLLPDFDVRENLLMAARAADTALSEARPRADALLAKVGLSERAHAAVTVLSGGERSRIALCRALLNRPRLLLADEPTGNLDPTTANVVLQLLLDLARVDRASVVIVTHDPAIAARCDRVLELRDGVLWAA